MDSFHQLEELNFVDDLAVLFKKHSNLQGKTNRLNKFAKHTDVDISSTKTQVMCINTSMNTPITVNGKPIDFVDDLF